MNLTKIVETAIQNGGVSYSLTTGETNPETGYMVGVSKEFEHSTMYLSDGEVGAYVAKHSVELAKPNRFLGIWFDGMYYVLDVSERFATKRNALFFGIIRQQDAIWDNAGEKTIKIVVKNDPASMHPDYKESDEEVIGADESDIEPETGVVKSLHHIEHDKEVEQKLNKAS